MTNAVGAAHQGARTDAMRVPRPRGAPPPDGSPHGGPLTLAKIPDRAAAIGLAVELLSLEDSFAPRPFGPTARTVAGQVRRDHYLFVRRGPQVLGYCGWALCDAVVADRWVSGRGAPESDACLDGDTVVIVTLVAQEPAAIRLLARAARREYPGRRFVYRRVYAGERPGRTASFTIPQSDDAAPLRPGPSIRRGA